MLTTSASAKSPTSSSVVFPENLTMAFSTVRGARIAWQQMGEGEDVILVHGLGTHRGFWLTHALQLSQQFRVTLFDLRGHGYSERTHSGYSPESLGHDVLGLMDALEMERAAVIGHSYGGAAALEAAATQPHRFSALGILDARCVRFQHQMWLHEMPTLTPFEREIYMAHDLDWDREPQVGLRFLEIAARRQVQGRTAQCRDAVMPFGEGRGALRTAQRWLDLIEETAAWDELSQPGATRAEIAAVHLPTLLVYGRASRCLPSGRALRSLWPHADYLEIADAGHFFPISHAGLVQQALLGLLRPVEQPQRAAA